MQQSDSERRRGANSAATAGSSEIQDAENDALGFEATAPHAAAGGELLRRQQNDHNVGQHQELDERKEKPSRGEDVRALRLYNSRRGGKERGRRSEAAKMETNWRKR